MFNTEAEMHEKVTQVVQAAGGTVFLLDQIVLESNIGGTGASHIRQNLYEFHGDVAVSKRFSFIKSTAGQCWFVKRMYPPSRTVVVHDYELVPPVPQIQDDGV